MVCLRAHALRGVAALGSFPIGFQGEVDQSGYRYDTTLTPVLLDQLIVEISAT